MFAYSKYAMMSSEFDAVRVVKFNLSSGCKTLEKVYVKVKISLLSQKFNSV